MARKESVGLHYSTDFPPVVQKTILHS
jgi:hypothetical protein